VLLSALFQGLFITLDAFFSDEGLVLVAASDVAEGRVLYRDCYVPVTPAVYWLEGLAFKLFGSRFLVSRGLMAALHAATVALVFVVAARFLSPRRAMLAGALAIPLQLWMWPHAHFFSYHALATAFCVLAIALALRVEAGPRRPGFAAALGAALGAGLWTKPNLALATGAGVLLYWLGAWLRSRVGPAPPRPRGLADLLREGLAVLAGIAAISAAPLGYLLATGSLAAMLRSLGALARIYGDVPADLFPSALPPTAQLDALRLYPGLLVPGLLSMALWEDPGLHYLLAHTGWLDGLVRLLYYAPLALWLALALAFARRLARRRWTPRDEAALLTFCAGGALYATIVPHPALHYMVPTLLPLLPLAVHLVSQAEEAARPRARAAIRLAAGGLLALYASASVAALALYLRIPRAPVPSPAGTLWMPRATARLWNDILGFVRERVPEGQAIFAYPYFPLLYFLAGRDHATPFVDLRPGSPGAGAEDEIIEGLERSRVEFVFYFVGSQYPSIEPFHEAYPRLARHLETRFEAVRDFVGPFGTYAEVRRRKARGEARAQAVSRAPGAAAPGHSPLRSR